MSRDRLPYRVPTDEITMDDVLNLVRSRIEDVETPERILAVLEPDNGKRLTKRHADKIANALGNDARVLIIKHYGWTELDITVRSPKYDRFNFIVQRSEKNVVINTDYIRSENPAWFSAAVERNRQRENYLDPVAASQIAETTNNLRQAINEFQNVTHYHGIENPDHIVMEKLALGQDPDA